MKLPNPVPVVKRALPGRAWVDTFRLAFAPGAALLALDHGNPAMFVITVVSVGLAHGIHKHLRKAAHKRKTARKAAHNRH